MFIQNVLFLFVIAVPKCYPMRKNDRIISFPNIFKDFTKIKRQAVCYIAMYMQPGVGGARCTVISMPEIPSNLLRISKLANNPTRALRKRSAEIAI